MIIGLAEIHGKTIILGNIYASNSDVPPFFLEV